MKKSKKKKLKSIQWHKKRAWKEFSEYVRRSAKGVCFTCGKVDDWRNCHAGHFKHHRLDFDAINVKNQCAGCNTFGDGKLDVYAEKLEQIYGYGIIQILGIEAKKIKKWTREELDNVYLRYRNINESLRKELKEHYEC